MKTGWSKIHIIDAALSDVTWIDANHLSILVPNYREIFNSNDGGNSWSPLTAWAYGVNITSTPNGSLYWALGFPNHTWLNRYQNNIADSVNLNITAPDLVFLNDSVGYASLTSSPGLAKTHNGGTTWELAATGIPNFGPGGYSTLFFLDSNRALISFDRKIYYTNQGISSWNQSTISAPSGSNIYCSKVQVVSSDLSYAGFSDGSLFRSIDSGKSFTPVQLPLTTGPVYWVDFQFLDANNGFLCYQNTILHTADGGNTWDTAVFDKNSRFIELEFFDAHHGAAVAESGYAYLYKN